MPAPLLRERAGTDTMERDRNDTRSKMLASDRFHPFKGTTMRRIPVSLAVLLGGLVFASAALPCSRILWNNNKLAVVVSRTMDWPESTEPVLS